MHIWLRDYAYQIDIEWWIFGLAGELAIAFFCALEIGGFELLAFYCCAGVEFCVRCGVIAAVEGAF